MSGLAGYDGKVKWAFSDTTIYLSDATHNLYSWKLDFTAEALDSTNFTTTGWRTFLAGLKQWSASVEAFVDDTNSIPVSDVGSTARIYLYNHISDATIGNLLYKGDAICTGIHPSVSVDGIQTQTLDFQGTSDLIFSDV